ncbi:hypothetical protein [Hymenobacter bucti]|uniref:Uncharacterized protein n=1 Tax=Hymenobacter bucti TaxID=1844114 RepID=A0ABW4QXG0_9BACT
MISHRMSFEQVCHLQPGDALLEIEGQLSATGAVTSAPVVTIDETTSERCVTFEALMQRSTEELPEQVDYRLCEWAIAYGPRLFCPPAEPTAPSPPSVPAEPPRPTLGELDIPSNLDALFLLGELLATLNHSECLAWPGFYGDVVLHPRTGKWVVVNAGGLAFGSFTSTQAAAQFDDFTGDSLRAVLAGYARKARQVLEPVYPSFVDTLLAELLPTPVPQAPQLRPFFFDLPRVLQAYGTSLELVGSTRQLGWVAPAPPPNPPTDKELLLACVTVFVARLNLTEWLTHVAACEPTRELTQILGALARGDLFEPTWGGFIPKLLGHYRPQRALRLRVLTNLKMGDGLLLLIANLYDVPHRLAELVDKHAVFAFLRRTLAETVVISADTPAERLAQHQLVLGSLIDALDDLALLADAQGQTHSSLIFAQASLLALQQLPPLQEPTQAEEWLARLQAQQWRYSWYHQPEEGVPLPTNVVWQYAAYAGSLRLAVLPFCQQAGEWYAQGSVTNQLWTMAWWVLDQLRQGERLAYAWSQAQLEADDQLASVELTLYNLLTHHQKALRDLVAMLQRSGQPGRRLSAWATLGVSTGAAWDSTLMRHLVEEQERLVVAYDALATHGYGSQVHASLGQLVTELAT